MNAVTVAVNWRLAPPEMDFILHDAEAKVVVVEAEFAGHLEKMDLPLDPLIITVGREGDHIGFDDWISGMSTDDPQHLSRPDDTAMQVYTSGTTGLLKGAELSNRNFHALIRPLEETIGVNRESVMLHLLPLFHIGGGGTVQVGLSKGCTDVIHRDVDPTKILADIPRYGVTFTAMVPALLQVLPMIPGASDTDFSSLETVLYGASPITEEVLAAAMALLKCPMGQMYGLTETSGSATWLAPEDHDPGGPRTKLLRSAGKPLPGTELRIVDTDGTDVPDGEVGEIWLRSVQNMKGCWKNPEATAAAFPEGRDDDGFGWLATGDAGYVEDGHLFIHDRIKDMIVSGGENIYPAEIENAIMAHPDVGDVGVIGIPSERWGESPLALIVPADGADPTAQSIIEFCGERLARFKLPTAVEFVAELPRNPTGKLLKAQLREPYWEGRERAVN